MCDISWARYAILLVLLCPSWVMSLPDFSGPSSYARTSGLALITPFHFHCLLFSAPLSVWIFQVVLKKGNAGRGARLLERLRCCTCWTVKGRQHPRIQHSPDLAGSVEGGGGNCSSHPFNSRSICQHRQRGEPPQPTFFFFFYNMDLVHKVRDILYTNTDQFPAICLFLCSI